MCLHCLIQDFQGTSALWNKRPPADYQPSKQVFQPYQSLGLTTHPHILTTLPPIHIILPSIILTTSLPFHSNTSSYLTSLPPTLTTNLFTLTYTTLTKPLLVSLSHSYTLLTSLMPYPNLPYTLSNPLYAS